MEYYSAIKNERRPFSATWMELEIVIRASQVDQWVKKESTCNAGNTGDTGSASRLGRPPGEGNGNPLQYSCLENPMTEEHGRHVSMGSQRDGKTKETVRNFILGGSKITADDNCSYEIKMLASWKKSYDQPSQHIKNQRHYFANKGPSSQSYGFSSGHEWMWEFDYKESWALKNRCIWTVVLKTLESPPTSQS